MSDSTSITRHDGHGHTTTTVKKSEGITATELAIAAAVLIGGYFLYEKLKGSMSSGSAASALGGGGSDNGFTSVLNDGSGWTPSSTLSDVTGGGGSSSNTYTVVSGDTPSGIARKFTGNAARYPELFASNPGKSLVDCYSIPSAAGGSPSSQCVPHGTAASDVAPGTGASFTSSNFANLQPGDVLTLPASWPASPQS